MCLSVAYGQKPGCFTSYYQNIPPPSIYDLQNFICIALWLVLNAEFYGLRQWNLKAVKRERKKKVTSKLCTLLVRCRSVTRHIQSVHKISLFGFAVSLNVFFMNV